MLLVLLHIQLGLSVTAEVKNLLIFFSPPVIMCKNIRRLILTGLDQMFDLRLAATAGTDNSLLKTKQEANL